MGQEKKGGKKEDKWKVKKNEKHIINCQLFIFWIIIIFVGYFFYFMSVYMKQIDNTPKCTEKKDACNCPD